jgi:hypothetical protein
VTGGGIAWKDRSRKAHKRCRAVCFAYWGCCWCRDGGDGCLHYHGPARFGPQCGGSRMRAGRGSRVVAGLCMFAHAGLAAELAAPMLELGCSRTHTGAPCAVWGGDTGTPANASCAVYPGEPVGWCWVDGARTQWEFCDLACRADAENPEAEFDFRDRQVFPALNVAVGQLHRPAPDVDAAIKALTQVVATGRGVVQEHWDKGGKGEVGPSTSFLAPLTSTQVVLTQGARVSTGYSQH